MTILIADDIKIIRSGIISALSKSYTGLSFLEAEDGEATFAITQQHEVDLIITDIKMPRCDGLQLISRLREDGFDKPIIILSGFGEFEYAEKALNMGVVGYLLKPIEDEKLCAAVEKAISQLHQNRSAAYLKEENRQLNRQNRQARLSHVLQNAVLLSCAIEDMDELEGQYFCMAVVSIQRDFYEATEFLSDETELVRYAVRNVVEYLDQQLCLCVILHPADQRQLLLVFYDSNADELQNTVYITSQQIRLELINTIHIAVTVGVSDTRSTADGELYRHALDALNQRVLYEQDGVYLYSAQAMQGIAVQPQDTKLINGYIEQRSLQHLEQLLSGRLREYAARAGVRGAVEMLTPITAQSLIRLYGGRAAEAAGELSAFANTLGDFNDIEEIAAKLTQIVADFFVANDIAPQQEETIVRRVREYIEAHYNEDFSVRELAKRFSLNYSYLSSLFAKEVGVGIAAYGTGIRIETAKTLLAETSADIVSIAGTIGYEDLQYFYRVFKKHTGLTPMHFRNNTKKIQ